MAEDKQKMVVKNLRLSARFSNVVFPVDMTEFARTLMNSGYALTTQIPPPDTTSITRLAYAGPIARKGSVVVDANSEKQFVGVSSADLPKLIEGFDEVLRIASDKRTVGGPLSPWFHEFQGHLEYSSGRSPLESLKELGTGVGFLSSWSRILKADASFIGFKIAPVLQGPDSPDFFEVVVEPSPGKSDSSFEVIVIMRNTNADRVKEFARAIEKTVSDLMNSL